MPNASSEEETLSEFNLEGPAYSESSSGFELLHQLLKWAERGTATRRSTVASLLTIGASP